VRNATETNLWPAARRRGDYFRKRPAAELITEFDSGARRLEDGRDRAEPSVGEGVGSGCASG